MIQEKFSQKYLGKINERFRFTLLNVFEETLSSCTLSSPTMFWNPDRRANWKGDRADGSLVEPLSNRDVIITSLIYIFNIQKKKYSMKNKSWKKEMTLEKWERWNFVFGFSPTSLSVIEIWGNQSTIKRWRETSYCMCASEGLRGGPHVYRRTWDASYCFK